MHSRIFQVSTNMNAEPLSIYDEIFQVFEQSIADYVAPTIDKDNDIDSFFEYLVKEFDEYVVVNHEENSFMFKEGAFKHYYTEVQSNLELLLNKIKSDGQHIGDDLNLIKALQILGDKFGFQVTRTYQDEREEYNGDVVTFADFFNDLGYAAEIDQVKFYVVESYDYHF